MNLEFEEAVVAEVLTGWRDTECIGYALTQEEAMAFHDFIHARLFGWNVAISSNNPRGMCDGRFTSTKIGDRLLREVFLNETDWRDSVTALMAGTEPARLWPEPLREFIRFCIEHRCPREINEPLSEEGHKRRTEMQGMPPWPDFLRKYDKPGDLGRHAGTAPAFGRIQSEVWCMNVHASKLDVEKFRKVRALMDQGATEGERAAAKARAEALAMKAGMTFAQAVSKLDGDAPAKPANFFDGFDDWMEEREPGYKARCAAARAEKEAADTLLRKEILAKYGTEQALFSRTERERLLAAAIHDMAEWRDWTDDDGIVHIYADKIDGKREFWRRRDLTDRVYAAVFKAYPVPTALAEVLAEYHDWRALQRERDPFSGGDWQHHSEVEARIAVLKDELDNQPAASWDDMDARMAWWDECMTWGIMPNGDEERLRKERIAADLQFLRGYNSPAGVQVGQPEKATSSKIRNQSRSNADIRNAVLSDLEIARLVGANPRMVGKWRETRNQYDLFST